MMNNEIQELLKLVHSDSSLSEDEKNNLCTFLLSARKPLETDRWIYRLVVSFLGMAIVLTIAGGIYLTTRGGNGPNYQLPQGIVAIGSAAVGALAGLLAPSPVRRKD